MISRLLQVPVNGIPEPERKTEILSAAELEKEISDASKEKRSLSPSAELTKD